VSPVIGLPTKREICQIIRMSICNEIVLELIKLLFIIIVFLVILINFGFNIEKLITAFASTFSAMAL